MPESKTVSRPEPSRAEDPSPALGKLLSSLVVDPQKWLSTPSVQFGGRKPSELVGTDEEFKIIDLLNAVDQGLF